LFWRAIARAELPYDIGIFKLGLLEKVFYTGNRLPVPRILKNEVNESFLEENKNGKEKENEPLS
jgi:hypothetical protein